MKSSKQSHQGVPSPPVFINLWDHYAVAFFGTWSLELHWMLELGIWSFLIASTTARTASASVVFHEYSASGAVPPSEQFSLRKIIPLVTSLRALKCTSV